MPFDKGVLIAEKATPKNWREWGEEAITAAKRKGLLQLSVVTDHHIMPQNKIIELRTNAIMNATDKHLKDATKYAIDFETIDQGSNPNDKENCAELMKTILWAKGNVIPGPMNTRRIDDPMDDGGWEKEEALIEAYQYAKKLKQLLEEIGKKSDFNTWKALVEHVCPYSIPSKKAQNDILNWADAWATDDTFKVYTRLNQEQTKVARRQNDSFAGSGAWVFPDGGNLKTATKPLKTYFDSYIKSDNDGKKEIVKELKKETGNNNCESWLEKHQRPPIHNPLANR
ncbi:hypothetical protein [Vibrio spartinae]|uniref:Uncharacterized protein n=1 Tax=Vibrio spartinae TaxID=1918945 RepID=A0A1N6MAZ1_9VIBR|nr:hypothetical protein [Vibrio spartinae]SIO96536.1 hypothetical protein VSP9026_04339 [Vibrio spartinae]